jgi:hypothetical protein
MDRNTRNPYWNRCIFLGNTDGFEDGEEDGGMESGKQTMATRREVRRKEEPPAVQRLETLQIKSNVPVPTRGDYRGDDDQCVRGGRGESSPSADYHNYSEGLALRRKSRYQADLDAYLSKTYG